MYSRALLRLPPVLLAGLLAGGCVTTNQGYLPPAPSEPAALVKLKYSFADFMIGKQFFVSMWLKRGADDYKMAYYRLYGPAGKPTTLDIGSANIHAGKPLQIRMSLTFQWREQRRIQQSVVVNGQATLVTRRVWQWVYRGCTAGLYLTPETGKVYLLDYTNPNINTNCTIAGYEQTAMGEGKFKLKKAGEFMQVR